MGDDFGTFCDIEHLKGDFCLAPVVRLDQGLLYIRVLIVAFGVRGGRRLGHRLKGGRCCGHGSREFFTLNMFSLYVIRLDDSDQVTNRIYDRFSFGVWGQIRSRRKRRRSCGKTRGLDWACEASVCGSAL